MEKNYVAIDDIWPYVQERYNKAAEHKDVQGMNWCNYFLQLLCVAEHKKIEVEEKD